MNISNTTNQENNVTITIIRMAEVIQITGLSKASIWRKIKDQSFPIPIKLGSRAIGWYSHEINEYLISLPRVNTLNTPNLVGENYG